MRENTEDRAPETRGRKYAGGRKRNNPDYTVVSGTVPRALRDQVWNRIPKSQKVDDFVTGLLTDWLARHEGREETVNLPRLGKVAGGPAILARENVEEYIAVPQQIARDATYCLTVTGDSMAPGIAEGDIVVVREQTTAASNQIVIAVFDDPEGRGGVVKRLHKHQQGEIELRSDNEMYEPILFGFQVIGRVVGLFRRID